MKQANGNTFRDDEMVILSRYDKRENRWVETAYPKVGGRLRLAHESNESLSITTNVIRFEPEGAVVQAVVKTATGEFSGLGTSSIERDKTIAPAILEMAETRAIARCLRFAGYGVEYCGAEEISHLSRNGMDDESSKDEKPQYQSGNGRNGRGNGNGNGNGSGNGGGDGRITNKQLNYIVNLGKSIGMDSKALDQESVSGFGVKLAHLTTKDASTFIDALKAKDAVPF